MVVEQSSNLIPMTLLTGYLGAGKTTLVNRILQGSHNSKIAVLVSDFGKINIESKFIIGIDGDMVTLANGCVCCTVHNNLIEVLDKLIKSDEELDAIILEASGITEPQQIIIDFNRSRLRSKIEIDSILAILDAEQFQEVTGKPERIIVEQLRLADKVIINKTDLVDSASIDRAKDFVADIAPKARILQAAYCEVRLDAILNVRTYNPQTAFDTSGHGIHVYEAETVHEQDHNEMSLVFGTWEWASDAPLAFREFRRLITNLPHQVFRAKGVVYLQAVPDRRVVLQMVGKNAKLTLGKSWGDETPHSQIVLIGQRDGIHKLHLQNDFDAIVEAEYTDEQPEFVDGSLSWLRNW